MLASVPTEVGSPKPNDGKLQMMGGDTITSTYVDQSTFDVIFMDMSMPVMDGLEATRQIRATCPGAPRILALTANALTTDRDACLKAGMDGFLSKPVRRNDILAQLAQQRATVPSD